MTRFAALCALPLFCIAAPGFADVFQAEGTVSRVTLYPWGANVVREVRVELPAGDHELVVPGLPRGTPANSLRVAPQTGLRLGGVTLAYGRLPVADTPERADISAAEAEIERLEGVVRAHDSAIALVEARVAAANAQADFLLELATDTGADRVADGALDDLRALTRLVGEEILAARTAALGAEEEAAGLKRTRETDVALLKDARQTLDAIRREMEEQAVLSMTVSSASAGEAILEVTTFTDAARWSPVYDISLTQDAGEDEIDISRGVLVSQYSGEDWRDVALTLSTARPAEQSEPSRLWPDLRRIGPPEPKPELRSRVLSDALVSAPEAAGFAMEEPAVETADMALQGTTVTYVYPGKVDLRDGVEDLRLELGDLRVPARVFAQAVPRRDETAYLVGELMNDTGEILLPGMAQLMRDGVFVGMSRMGLVADGDSTQLGFGAIDGLRLERRIPERSEGDRGVLTSSNGLDEVAVLSIENLTDRAWEVRLLDQVPYSEQDDLVIRWSADPRPAEVDVDGLRGILAWEFLLEAAEHKDIRLEHSLKWPSGQVLQ